MKIVNEEQRILKASSVIAAGVIIMIMAVMVGLFLAVIKITYSLFVSWLTF